MNFYDNKNERATCRAYDATAHEGTAFSPAVTAGALAGFAPYWAASDDSYKITSTPSAPSW
jgi:hypothetical protein